MRFTETRLAGVFTIDLEPFVDERGLFARTFDADEFAEHGLSPDVVQANYSINHHRGTLRGFHYQGWPHGEGKTIRCVRGALFDVVLDLRPESATYLQHLPLELTADNRTAVYVPPGCANAFLTLEDETHAIYNVSHRYTPGAERGVRHSDPLLAIRWPIEVTRISDKDASWPLIERETFDPGTSPRAGMEAAR